jgi:hypothetical protein
MTQLDTQALVAEVCEAYDVQDLNVIPLFAQQYRPPNYVPFPSIGILWYTATTTAELFEQDVAMLIHKHVAEHIWDRI